MTKIEQLRAALNGDPLDRGYSLTLEEARELLGLVEMQHEALWSIEKGHGSEIWGHGLHKALQTFEEWNKP